MSVAYLAGIALFVANDFVWIAFQSGLRVWLGDLVFRLVILGSFLVWFRATRTSTKEASWFLFLVRSDPSRGEKAPRRLVLWTMVTVVCGVAVDQTLGPFLAHRLHSAPRFTFPELGGVFQALDLTIGVALVALSEELVFRSLALRLLLARAKSAPVRRPSGRDFAGGSAGMTLPALVLVVLSSSVVFGLAHWGAGLHAIITTAAWGILPMVALIRTGSLWPALIAHYVTDLVGFSGVIPDQYYVLFVP